MSKLRHSGDTSPDVLHEIPKTRILRLAAVIKLSSDFVLTELCQDEGTIVT